MDIDKKEEQVVGPHNACQTAMIRGLIAPWKQTIYYAFDQPMTKEIVLDILKEVYNANFIVVAIVSDMGTGNVKLWSALDVGYNKNSFFNHPCQSTLKVFVFADIPHLIKLARNHLLDKGFIIEGNTIKINIFEALLKISTSELTLAHKLTHQHLNVKGSMRQRVRQAVQVLSNTLSKAIAYSGEKGLLPPNCKSRRRV